MIMQVLLYSDFVHLVGTLYYHTLCNPEFVVMVLVNVVVVIVCTCIQVEVVGD